MLERRHRLATPRRRRYHVRFRLDEHQYTLPAEQLFGVNEVHRLTSIPSDRPWNLGVALFRGLALGVLDLRGLMNRTEKELPETPFFCIFCKTSKGVLGFPVDEIHGLASVFDDDVLPDGSEILNLELLENLA